MARRGENIRKRTDGRWEARFYVNDSVTHKKKMKSIYAKTYADAKAKLAKAKCEAAQYALADDNTSLMENSSVILTDIAFAWLLETSKSKKYSTYIKYKEIYEKHIADKLTGLSLRDLINNPSLNPFDPIQYKNENYSESIMKSVYCVINQILNYCNIHYHVNLHKTKHPKSHTCAKPVEIMMQSDQIKLFREIYKDMDINKFGILLCLSTGLRLGEICSLKWSDIDIHGKLLYVNSTVQRISTEGLSTKTTLREDIPKSVFSRREIPLPDEIMPYIISFQQSSGYVMAGEKPMEPRTYQYRFQKLLSDAGIRQYNFHVIRHTFATNCINSGIDVKSLSEILGHSSVNITLNRYVHPSIDTKRKHLNNLVSFYGQYVGHEKA